ncbi:hypothetical protein HNY73_022416 [Argiope bruennichi]|uniref:Uncharacterized protein n=1 Tax=Argiope bruennichi TaxID=94029 RepID=A0A8T0E1J7_ARGBR|nr:hypothetical protein HNY73_022416 [Argiope bruennichi]
MSTSCGSTFKEINLNPLTRHLMFQAGIFNSFVWHKLSAKICHRNVHLIDDYCRVESFRYVPVTCVECITTPSTKFKIIPLTTSSQTRLGVTQSLEAG